MKFTVKSLSVTALSLLAAQGAYSTPDSRQDPGTGPSFSRVERDAIPAAYLRKRASDNGTVTVIPMGYQDGLLTNYIELGDPQHLFEVTLDTGNGLTWVPSTKCTSKNCEGQDLYNPDESNTSKKLDLKPLEIKYEDGKCATLDLYSENLRFYKFDMDFPLAIGGGYKIEGFDDVDGYLGNFGFGGPNGITATDYLHKRALRDLERRGLIKRDTVRQVGGAARQMGVRVGNQGSYVPDKKKRDNDFPAYCIIGGIDDNLIQGDPVYVPLPSEEECGNDRFWKLAFNSVTLGDTQIDTQGRFAQFYSNSRYIHAPKEEAKALHDQIGATYDEQSGFYQLPCSETSNTPDLQFTFGSGNKATLKPTDWIKPVSEGSQDCRSYVKHLTLDTPNWLLGTAFTNPFYMIYDQVKEQIGFGYNAGEEITATIS
ncbi:aspartic peptidase domain-containing protein [Phascolomyces articulosus]|uniref:Aspartic peptidase domain-containing protein n=1 Tax=Phascolomyces articulosus TaxID=60185 RepID=A0AAD5K9V0_9FUNG|nr:aspartic peptidase domain-containing protein [Phascolomyces articulosus]